MAAASSVAGPCKNGFELWRKTIKACRYAMGPRDHIPDLAFRLLCRRHNVQLFYTPLLNAEEILNQYDSHKIQFLDSNNTQDRPLIAQLYSRDPDCMLKAAERVGNSCDAIDISLHSESNAKTLLNQAVGKDFNILTKMISLLRDNLNMPVACKIKITSVEDNSNLIKYAQRLESAGCQLISIGCRHKEPHYRLRDWDAIKAVQNAVDIPVFAFSDVSTLAEVDHCLDFTGAQGVMSYVNILHNPGLFTGLNPPLYEISKEFLDLCRQYPIPPKKIRLYIYALWKNYLDKKDDIVALQLKKEIHHAWTYEAIVAANEMLGENLAKVKETEHNDDSDSNVPASIPIWRCYSGAEIFKHQVDAISNDAGLMPSTMSMAKREKKRQLMKIHLNFKKQREREKKKINKSQLPLEASDDYISKRQRHILRDHRLENAMRNGQRIAIDMGLTHGMTKKEVSKLCNQIGRLYGSNCTAEEPWHIYFTRFEQNDELYQQCVRRHHGFEKYKISMTSDGILELFPPDKIVVMSPDSKNVLEKIDPDKVYVMGGIVDESIRKRLSLHYALQCEVSTCRLPIPEYMMKGEKGSFNQVLSINQVFDILLEFSKTSDWAKSLPVGIPQRKGWIAKTTTDQE